MKKRGQKDDRHTAKQKHRCNITKEDARHRADRIETQTESQTDRQTDITRKTSRAPTPSKSSSGKHCKISRQNLIFPATTKPNLT